MVCAPVSIVQRPCAHALELYKYILGADACKPNHCKFKSKFSLVGACFEIKEYQPTQELNLGCCKALASLLCWAVVSGAHHCEPQLGTFGCNVIDMVGGVYNKIHVG